MAAPFSGPYVGLFVGGTKSDVDYKLTPAAAKRAFAVYENDYTKYGFLGGAYLGYGSLFSNVYVGGEGSIHYDSANGWQNHSVNTHQDIYIVTNSGQLVNKLNFKTQYKKDLVFGLGLRLGGLVNKDTLVYVKPAVEISRDKFIQKSISLQGPGVQVADSEQESVSEWKVKLAPGVGTEYFVNSNVSVRLEYACSFGINGKMKDKENAEDGSRGEIQHISHALKIGISYSF